MQTAMAWDTSGDSQIETEIDTENKRSHILSGNAALGTALTQTLSGNKHCVIISL